MRWIFFSGIFLVLVACAQKPQAQPVSSSETPEKIVVKFVMTETESVEVHCEVADTAAEREQGLMFRESLADDQGMVFSYDEEQILTFWMKNTPLPLDIIFISADKIVVAVAADTIPYSEALISSGLPAQYAVEVNAGFAARNHIVPGMGVEF